MMPKILSKKKKVRRCDWQAMTRQQKINCLIDSFFFLTLADKAANKSARSIQRAIEGHAFHERLDIRTLTFSSTYMLTCLSPIHSLAHSLIHSLTHSLTHSPTHSLKSHTVQKTERPTPKKVDEARLKLFTSKDEGIHNSGCLCT